VPFFFKLLCTYSGAPLSASPLEVARSSGFVVGCVGIDQVVESDRDGRWFSQLARARGSGQRADGYQVDEGASDGDPGGQILGSSSLGRLSGRPESLMMSR
jgi:hypothetical protein